MSKSTTPNMVRFMREVSGGATAIVAAVVTVMAVGGTALIADVAWLVDQRDTLKSAADAGGIAATLELTRTVERNPDISDSDLDEHLRKIARRYVVMNLAHLARMERFDTVVESLVVTVDVDRRQRTVVVYAEADMGGTLLSKHMPMFSEISEETVRVGSKTERVINPIEVVLAIDISGSMNRCVSGRANPCPNRDMSRMAVVKRASANLVNILDPSAENRVAIGVVPWHMTVRLDESMRDEWEQNDWADYPLSRRYGSTYSCGRGVNSCSASVADMALPAVAPETWQGCLDEHRMSKHPLSGEPGHAALPAADAEPDTLLVTPAGVAFAQAFFPAPFGTAYECATYPGPPDLGLQFCYDTHHYAEATSWSERRKQTVKPVQHGCGDTQPVILPLTSDRAAVEAAIDDLDAVGSLTYSALGVLWGHRILDHNWQSIWGGTAHPVDPAVNPETRKALVLLTDGDDTYCDLGRGVKRSCQDSNIGVDRARACAAAKAAGMEVFVIAAMHPDDISGHLAATLRACSSEPPDSEESTYVFLNNSTPEGLAGAFADIAKQLSTIRRVY